MVFGWQVAFEEHGVPERVFDLPAVLGGIGPGTQHARPLQQFIDMSARLLQVLPGFVIEKLGLGGVDVKVRPCALDVAHDLLNVQDVQGQVGVAVLEGMPGLDHARGELLALLIRAGDLIQRLQVVLLGLPKLLGQVGVLGRDLRVPLLQLPVIPVEPRLYPQPLVQDVVLLVLGLQLLDDRIALVGVDLRQIHALNEAASHVHASLSLGVFDLDRQVQAAALQEHDQAELQRVHMPVLVPEVLAFASQPVTQGPHVRGKLLTVLKVAEPCGDRRPALALIPLQQPVELLRDHRVQAGEEQEHAHVAGLQRLPVLRGDPGIGLARVPAAHIQLDAAIPIQVGQLIEQITRLPPILIQLAIQHHEHHHATHNNRLQTEPLRPQQDCHRPSWQPLLSFFALRASTGVRRHKFWRDHRIGRQLTLPIHG